MATKKATKTSTKKAQPKKAAKPKETSPAAQTAEAYVPNESRVTKALSKKALSRKELQKAVGGTEEQLTALLQKLKRRGQIKKMGRQWVGSGVQVCPKCEGRGWIA